MSIIESEAQVLLTFQTNNTLGDHRSSLPLIDRCIRIQSCFGSHFRFLIHTRIKFRYQLINIMIYEIFLIYLNVFFFYNFNILRRI